MSLQTLTTSHDESFDGFIEKIIFRIKAGEFMQNHVVVVGSYRERKKDLIVQRSLNPFRSDIAILEVFRGVSFHFIKNVKPFGAFIQIIFASVHEQKKL